MDLGTLEIAFVLVAICVVPFILMGRNKKKRDKELLQLLFDSAAKENCKITASEHLNDIAIGLDEANNKLFFFKKIEKNEIAQHVNLLEMKSCGILNSNRPMDTKKNKDIIIEKIGLSFTPLEKNKVHTVFEFFNSEETMLLSGELQLAQKWMKIVNTILQEMPSKKEFNSPKQTVTNNQTIVKSSRELVAG